MREVLLIGDSIRMFCEKSLREKLGGGYHVSSPSENCRFAAYTRNSLRLWLPEFPKPEIIHWNNGLWDVARLYGENECFTPLDRYLDDLCGILRVLRSTGAKIIFSTTTPTDPRKEIPRVGMTSVHFNSDIISYNEAAVKLMRGNGIPVNDLFSVVYPRVHDYISDDLIHPNNNGIEAIASATADFIRNF